MLPCRPVLTRRSFLASTAAAIGCATAPPPAPPNVLILLSDQETERVPRGILDLPNRDRLDRMGVRFTRTWCATPQCSPARAALWTGRWPHRAGVVTNIGAVGGAELPTEIPSIGRLFRQAGYETGYFGKWHLTEGRGVDGEAFGYDHAVVRGRGDAETARLAADWIAEQSGPWFAIVSLLQPHDIYDYPGDAEESEGPMPIREGAQAPASDASDLASRPAPQKEFNDSNQGVPTAPYDADEWRRYRSYYYDLIEDVDANLGTVLEAVGQSDAIVVYTSDHGDMQGAHGLSFKGPFMYEELLNIPMTIAWPRGFEGGRKTDVLASQVDVLPTLLDLAGIAAPDGMDGVSLREELAGGTIEREEMFAEYHSKQQWANPIRSVRTEQWKLNQYLDGGRELYDLANDPGEKVNLAGSPDHAEIESEMYARLDRWAQATDDRLWAETRELHGAEEASV